MNQQNPANDDFFDDAVRTFAPSFKFANIGDVVQGEIVDQYKTEATVFGKPDEKKLDKRGVPIPQLVVVLQTNLRNWDRVAKIPKVDPTDRNSADKPASEDDGKRSVFLEKWTNIYAAVGQAVVVGTGQKGGVLNGGTLAIQFHEDEDRGKGNPLKKFRAKYTPPAASSGDFFDAPAVQQQVAQPQAQPQSSPVTQQPPATQQPAPAAAPAQDPWGTPAPAPVAQDPWASQPVQQQAAPVGVNTTDEPPF